MYFGGHVIFSGNNGTLGGALKLQGGSKFNLMPNTHVQIVNNHAKRGGGIYVEDQNVGSIDACFFQIFDLEFSSNVVITLENNTADEAGIAVYGGEIIVTFTPVDSQSCMKYLAVLCFGIQHFRPSFTCVASIIKSFCSPCVQPLG